MPLSLTITRGYTMVAGARPSVDDWNAAFLPNFTFSGSVGAGDIDDDAITFAALNPNFILGGTAIDDLESLDKFLIGQAGTGDNRVITFQYLLRSIIRECTASTTFTDYNEDALVYWRHADDLPNCIGVARFAEQLIEQSPAATTSNQDWEVLVRRSTESDGTQAARMSLRNLLPDIITAQTVNNPTQVVVDAKGRVVAISATEGAREFTSTAFAVPVQSSLGTAVESTPQAHGLGSSAISIEAYLKCTTLDAGWAVGSVIALDKVVWQPGSGSTLTLPALTPYADGTNIAVVANCRAADMLIQNKATGAAGAFTPGSWTITVTAKKAA